MASSKQLEANRANARRSAGPKTDLGRARSRLNSCRHGLTGQTVLIAGEDPADLEQHLQDLENDLEPASSIEAELVIRLTGYFWRLRRIPIFEAALPETRRTEFDDAPTPKDDPHRFASLERYRPWSEVKSPFPNALEEKMAPAQAALPTHEPVRDSSELEREKSRDRQRNLGKALIRNGQDNDTLGKLSRYEAALLNAANRTLRQLSLIQTARMAKDGTRQIARTSIVVSKK